MQTWFKAWELTATGILRVEGGEVPEMLFYDSACIWTTSPIAAPSSVIVDGPRLMRVKMPWRTADHGGLIPLPTGKKVKLGLMSFAGPTKTGKSFFVMGAPRYWRKASVKSKELGLAKLLVAVFLHEMTHTRQFYAFNPRIASLTKRWGLRDDMTDDAVQDRFAKTADYVEDYELERDLFFAAAAASDEAAARKLATEGLSKIRERHAKWFVGDDEKYRSLDEVFLTLEGLGNWAAYAWLASPLGGKTPPDLALKGVRRGGRQWSQDEGLALFLVIDRLLPDWKSHAFAAKPIEVFRLLELAVGRQQSGSTKLR